MHKKSTALILIVLLGISFPDFAAAEKRISLDCKLDDTTLKGYHFHSESYKESYERVYARAKKSGASHKSAEEQARSFALLDLKFGREFSLDSVIIDKDLDYTIKGAKTPENKPVAMGFMLTWDDNKVIKLSWESPKIAPVIFTIDRRTLTYTYSALGVKELLGTGSYGTGICTIIDEIERKF